MLVLHQAALGLAALAASAAAFTHSPAERGGGGAHAARRAAKFAGGNNRAKYVRDAYILQVDSSATGLQKRGATLASVSLEEKGGAVVLRRDGGEADSRGTGGEGCCE